MSLPGRRSGLCWSPPVIVDLCPLRVSSRRRSSGWCRQSGLVVARESVSGCYRSAGCPSSSVGSASSVYRSSVSLVGFGRRSEWSVVSRRRRRWWCPVASGCWSLLACRWSLFIASHPLSAAPLTQGSIHYHILDSLLLARLPSLPLSRVRFSAPPRFLRYATIH